MSRHQLILQKLIDARLGLTWEWAVESRKEKLPTGWLPLHAFQHEDCGGSAANVRMHELRSPEGTLASGAAKGIPIETQCFEYFVENKRLPIFAYRLALEPAQLIFIDREHCRLHKQLLAERGYELIETREDVGGGRAVRIKKRTPSPPGQQAAFL